MEVTSSTSALETEVVKSGGQVDKPPSSETEGLLQGIASQPADAAAQKDQVDEGPLRAVRVRIVVHEVKDLRRVDGTAIRGPCIKLKVGKDRKVIELKAAGDGSTGNFISGESCTFDIKDVKNAVLRIKLAVRNKVLRDDIVARCSPHPVKALLEQCAQRDQACATWYPLVSKDGSSSVSGQVLMHIAATTAQPEHKISVFVGTWNVGNAAPPEDLSPWLPTDAAHEIAAIGAQECDYAPRAGYPDCASDWLATIRQHFGSRYKLVQATSRGQMRLVVLVREDVELAIMEVDSNTEATGIGHVMANKGGVCICFKFWDTGLCFVNSHLAAHTGQHEARNNNYQEIVSNTAVGRATMDILSQFQHVFWFGDLNYRLSYGSPEDIKAKSPSPELFREMVEKIEREEYDDLFKHDELSREIADGKAFHGFKEGTYHFPPTFKVLREEGEKYTDKRTPAWCDRILWRSMPGGTLEQTALFSAPRIATSDHKPVGATFKLKTVALPQGEVDTGDVAHRWHLEFKSLKANDLRAADLNGLSDPYVVFLGSALENSAHTRNKEKTLSPVWNVETEVPLLCLSASSLARLEHEFIMVQVVDYDVASADDIIGRGVLSLRNAVEAYNQGALQSTPFKVELTYNGLPAGSLEGQLMLSFQPRQPKRSLSLKGELMERSGSLKTSLKKILNKRLSKQQSR